MIKPLGCWLLIVYISVKLHQLDHAVARFEQKILIMTSNSHLCIEIFRHTSVLILYETGEFDMRRFYNKIMIKTGAFFVHFSTTWMAHSECKPY